jgi:hypothetical protein
VSISSLGYLKPLAIAGVRLDPAASRAIAFLLGGSLLVVHTWMLFHLPSSRPRPDGAMSVRVLALSCSCCVGRHAGVHARIHLAIVTARPAMTLSERVAGDICNPAARLLH